MVSTTNHYSLVVVITSQQRLVVSLLGGAGGINFIFMLEKQTHEKLRAQRKEGNTKEGGNPDVAGQTVDKLLLLSKFKLSISTFSEHIQFVNLGFDA